MCYNVRSKGKSMTQRETDRYKRQLTVGEQPACEMAKSELTHILTTILPEMKEVQT